MARYNIDRKDRTNRAREGVKAPFTFVKGIAMGLWDTIAVKTGYGTLLTETKKAVAGALKGVSSILPFGKVKTLVGDDLASTLGLSGGGAVKK